MPKKSSAYFKLLINLTIAFLLVSTIFHILPVPISIVKETSAGSTWSQATESDFSSGSMSQAHIEGSGNSAYITLFGGKTVEILTNKPETSWGKGSSTQGDPYNTYMEDCRAQTVYLASELKQAGLTAGSISGIFLKCSETPGRPNLANFRIRMQQTTDSSSINWKTTGWTLVYGPTAVNPSAGSWLKYDLTKKFNWDGTSNLMIDISRDDMSYQRNGGMYIRYFNFSARTYAGYSNSGYAWPFDNMWGTTYSIVPSIKITTSASEGYFTSIPYNVDGSVEWNTISWTATTTENAKVKFQLRSGSDQVDLSSKSFVGPDGSSATYYTTSGSEIGKSHLNDQWIQYKAYLSTTQPTDVPKLHDVSISYNYLPDKPNLLTPINDIWINNNKPKFSWTFNDIDSTSQSAFQLQLDDDDNFTSINYDTGKVTSSSNTYKPSSSYADGIYYWRVRTCDDEDAWSSFSDIGKIKIDTKINPPLIITVSPNNWTATNRFIVDWSNPSDLSGFRTGAYYYIGKNPPESDEFGTWSLMKPIYISDAPIGENNIYIWLEDNVGNKDYSKYGVGVLKLDHMTPPKPEKIMVTPKDWTSINEFSIDWIEPLDEAGINPGAYYFIGDSEPFAQYQGVWQAGKPITITEAPEGENEVYIWLEDSLGNSNCLNYSIATLKLDTTPPNINHKAITKGIHSKEIVIDVEVSDEASGVEEVLLFFKRPNDLTYATMELKFEDQRFTGTIPSNVVSDAGLEYYLKATDKSNPNNYIYYGHNGQTSFEPTALTDIDIKISSLPAVIDCLPKDDKVSVDSNITIIFNKSMQQTSTEVAFSISPMEDGIFIWNSDRNEMIFDPDNDLVFNATYIITISEAARDSEGNNFADKFYRTFTTEEQPEDFGKSKTESPSHEKGATDNDYTVLYGLVGFGFIIIIVLIFILLFVFMSISKRKSELSESESESTGLANQQGTTPTPTQAAQQSTADQSTSTAPSKTIKSMDTTPVLPPAGTITTPDMVYQQQYTQYTPKPDYMAMQPMMPMTIPMDNTTIDTTGGSNCPNCGAFISDPNSCPYCGWYLQF